jgi:hypothetical protein
LPNRPLPKAIKRPIPKITAAGGAREWAKTAVVKTHGTSPPGMELL